jgi:voltage-gated potassium channel
MADTPQLAAERDHLRAFLARAPLFRAMPPEALDWLMEQVRGHAVAAGTVVMRQGDPAEDLYLVESGRLAVTTATGGRNLTLGQLGPGDFFGEMALLRKSPRSATITALTDARLWALSRTGLIETIRQHPTVGDHLRAVTRQRALANALHALQ